MVSEKLTVMQLEQVSWWQTSYEVGGTGTRFKRHWQNARDAACDKVLVK